MSLEKTLQTPLQTPLQKFDQERVRKAFDRAAESYDEFAVLQTEVCNRLLEKLDIVKIKPQMILDVGSGTGVAIPALYERYKKAQLVALDISEKMLNKSAQQGSFFRSPHLVCADMEQLPFEDNTFELVFSSLSMQWCNDLNAALTEVKRVLKPGGLFVFTTFGPDTLKELRQSWSGDDGSGDSSENSSERSNLHVNQHVNQFIDMHDIGDALLLDGYAEPVMEAEILTVTYDAVDLLMHDLKAIGANVTANGAQSDQDQLEGRRKGLGGKSELQRMRKNYEQFRKDGLLPASYEIIYGHAWKHDPAETKKPTVDKQFVHFNAD